MSSPIVNPFEQLQSVAAPSGPLPAQAIDNPFASAAAAQATPQAPPQSTLSKVGDIVGDVATGFGKGAMQTVNGVSSVLNKIPVVGETLAHRNMSRTGGNGEKDCMAEHAVPCEPLS